MEKLNRENFEFAGETFSLGEEVIVTHREPGYLDGVRNYLGVIEYISPESKTVLNELSTNIKLDSRKHMMDLRYIEKIEKVTEEKRKLFYEKENERKKKLNTKYKKIEILLKEIDGDNEYIVTCDGETIGSGNTLQEAITNFDKSLKK